MREHDDIFVKVVSSAKRELRRLCKEGKAEQALDMSDALRNMPSTLGRAVVWSNARFIDKISMCACNCRVS
jgi:hypothetical protein